LATKAQATFVLNKLSLKSHFYFAFFLLAALTSCASNGKMVSESNQEKKILFTGVTFEKTDLSILRKKKGDSLPVTFEFDQCTFKDELSFGPAMDEFQSFQPSLLFRNCSFEGEIKGNRTQFSGQVSFGKCRFKKPVSVQNSVFLSPASFIDCTFDQDAQFQNAIFLKESSWQSSHFYGIAFFQSVRFFEKAQFSNVVFHSNADFTLCRFSEGASFDFARSEGKLDLSESRLEGLTTFRKAELLKRVSIENLRSFGQLRFLNTRFEDSLSSKGARFFAEKPEIIQPQGAIRPIITY